MKENNEKENLINDYQEQYDVLVAEEEEKQKKKTFWIIFFCLLIILFSVLGATYSFVKIYDQHRIKMEMNIDIDGDGKPDLNIDIDNDGICDINCDTDNDRKPNYNINYRNNSKAIFNVDTNGDGIPDGVYFIVEVDGNKLNAIEKHIRL